MPRLGQTTPRNFYEFNKNSKAHVSLMSKTVAAKQRRTLEADGFANGIITNRGRGKNILDDNIIQVYNIIRTDNYWRENETIR